jgi:hypothetical protein
MRSFEISSNVFAWLRQGENMLKSMSAAFRAQDGREQVGVGDDLVLVVLSAADA